MGTQFHLSAELTEVQNRLRGLDLPESRVDRDQLFYNAGIAAGAVSDSRRHLFAWQAASGVLAASVLVLSVMLSQVPDSGQVVARTESSSPSEESLVSASAPVEVAQVQRPIRHWPDSASLLTLRDAALRMELPEPKLVAYSQELQESKGRSAHELLREMLPRGVAPKVSENGEDNS